ncbi:hypothetical protein C0J52_28326 [Blattella germanica]|nr:hypothetical protein C0J52_28326 [Blattella germanica]
MLVEQSDQEEITELKNPRQLKLKRGESKKLQHEDVTAVVWHDNRDVLLLSTNSDPRFDGTIKRKINNINHDLREVDYTGNDWKTLAQDRDVWRAYVRTAMNLRVR